MCHHVPHELYLKQVVFRGDFQVLSIDRTWVGSLERIRHDRSISELHVVLKEKIEVHLYSGVVFGER
jgi:hypothetical protein